MNNKGQTLVIFILIIPLIIMLAAFVVDNAMMTYKNIELRNVTRDIIKVSFKNSNFDENKIKDIYIKNDIPTKELNISINNNKITISNQYYIDSIFGKIIGLKSYEVKASITGKKVNDKVVFN